MQSVGVWWMWAIFAAAIILMLAIDLFAFKGGREHKISVKEAASWSAAWVAVSLLFCLGLWFYLKNSQGIQVANEDALLFLTAYLLEKSLSVDNVFVWMMIFGYFSVPVELQRRVLLYGILGAIFLRTVLIFSGSWLISEFHWILYLFGAFLVFTGIKMLLPEDEPSMQENGLVTWLRKHLRITNEMHHERFFVRQNGLLYATPLLLTLIVVELSDVLFAVDSIPAVFALTTDPFIVLTSNLFAVLGLRAMYFLVADIGDRFALLKYGLAIILAFIGVKMLIVEWIKIPVLLSLAVVLGVLVLSVVFSLLHSRKKT
jgi:tellurite resistance protein TerC